MSVYNADSEKIDQLPKLEQSIAWWIIRAKIIAWDFDRQGHELNMQERLKGRVN
jgi:hypothetical protein